MLQPLHALILEDQATDLELLVREIKNNGFDLVYRRCITLEELISEFKTDRPDIVISDFNLPTCTGKDALIAIREHDQSIPFLLVSGEIGEEEAVRLIVEYGANDYILKDRLIRLGPAIRRELDQVELREKFERNQNELKKLSHVADHAINGVVITNAEGIVEWVNEAYSRITGYSYEERVGKKHPLFDTEKTSVLQEQLTTTFTLGEYFTFKEEVTFAKKDGTPYDIKLDVYPVLDQDDTVAQYVVIKEDISARKKAERELRDTYELLRKAQELGRIGNWKYDLEHEKMVWSDILYTVFDRDPSRGPAPYKELMEVYHREMSAFEKNIVDNTVKAGGSFDIDMHITTDNGEEKYIRNIATTEWSEDGKPKALVGILQDITVQKKAQVALEEQEMVLSEIINSVKGVLLRYILHPDGTDEFKYVSDGVYDLLGVSPTEAMLETTALWGQVHNDDLQLLKQNIHQSAATLTNWSYTYRAYHRDGTMKMIRGNGVPERLPNGSIIWNSLIVDITEQYKLESEIREAKKFYELAVDGGQIGLWELDLRDGSIFYNPMWSQMLGYEDGEIPRTKEHFLDLLHPEDKEKPNTAFVPLFKGAYGMQEVLIRLRSKDGSYRWILDRAQVVKRDKEGKPIRIAGSHLDITNQKEAELMLKATVEEKSILVEEIHHRVKNNLAIVSGLLELQSLMSKTDQFREAINRIHSIALVHEQLYKGRNLSKVDVELYFVRLIRVILSSYSKNDDDYIFDMDTNETELNINQAVPLGLLLNELITNSVKYAFPEGKGIIKVRFVRDEHDVYHFEYSDSGNEFDPETFENSKGFGRQLILTLLDQLQANHTFNYSKGFVLSATFERQIKGAHSNKMQ
ncbi:MAG: PAS domain-containing protein [Bacteroidota bacterium]